MANPTTQIAMLAGDISFALTSDPSYSAVAHEYVVGAARKAARVTRKKALPAKKTVQVVRRAARNAAKQIATSRKQLATTRLATRPPAKVAKAKAVVAKLKTVPTAKRPSVIAKVAKKTVAKTQNKNAFTAAPTFAPADEQPFETPLDASTSEPFDMSGVEEPEEVEELQDVADAAWEEETELSEPLELPLDDEETEVYESIEGEYDGSSCVGWNPFSSIKKAVKSVVKNPIARGIATGGISTVIENRKAIAKTAVVLSKSPYIKAGVAGLAVAFPAVGVPAAAALAVADKVVTASEQGGDIAKAAKDLIRKTHKQAKTGDKDASRALALMANVKKQKALTVASRRAKLPDWKQRVIATLEK